VQDGVWHLIIIIYQNFTVCVWITFSVDALPFTVTTKLSFDTC